MYKITTTKSFDRDVKRILKQGRNIRPLLEVIDLLKTGNSLPAKHKDHQLKGDQKHFRECHIAPDWVLKYFMDRACLILVLSRTGTHRDVLGVE